MRFIGRKGTGVCGGEEGHFALMPRPAAGGGGGIDGSLLPINYTLEDVLR